MKKILLIIGIVSLLLLTGCDYGYQIPSNGNTRADLWCGFGNYNSDYSLNKTGQYCGDIQVNMKCRFTNQGDHCVINKVLNQEKEEQ